MDSKEAYNKMASHYDCDFVKPICRAEDSIVIRLLQAGKYTEGVVCDLGCGSGFLLDNVPIAPENYLGIDFAMNMLIRARAKHPQHSFLEADMQDLDMLEFMGSIGRFDNAVLLYGSIDYCEDPQAVIGWIRKLLKPAGRFFIMFYGKRYHKRKSYILNRYETDVPMTSYREHELREIFYPFNVSITGLNTLGDWVPGCLAKPYLNFEFRHLSRFFLDNNYFLIVEGENESLPY